ncbi:hypothetical protein [Lacrimispora sp.]|uniref:hypothetical protein n=1 Tax=Lacrimispora sp. TaxID=2719234 RepID=UPI002FD9225C
MEGMTSFSYIGSYKFSVYSHQLIIFNDRLISRQFIVLKDSYGNIVRFTTLHRHIHSNNNKLSKPITDDGNNRFWFVCAFLNFVFIKNFSKYQITSLTDLTIDMVKDFFVNYGTDSENGIVARTEATVNRCVQVVLAFLESYLEDHESICKLKRTQLYKIVTYRSKRTGKALTKTVPTFTIYHAGRPREIFRDMPNAVFELVMSYAMSNYVDIAFMLAFSSFAGLRPSECCNVRQEISPLGSGLLINKVGLDITSVTIDLTEEKNLRSDLLPVGRIKKERKQRVYPKFLPAFLFIYEKYKVHLSTCKFEMDYCPMFVNSRGKAMTYKLYRLRFQTMIKRCIPLMLASDNPEIVAYGHMMLEYNISPHIFRHWFSVKLCLFGEDVAGLQYWRGDRNPESALTYLQNKGDLEKQLSKLNNIMFDFMNYNASRKDCNEKS